MENRKAFNFFRSYYDIAKELPLKDRGAFLWAILEKQFENIDPELEGMSKFAYISQKHSIEKQVKGYLDKIGALNNPTPTEDPKQDPIEGGTEDPKQDPSVQEKEK